MNGQVHGKRSYKTNLKIVDIDYNSISQGPLILDNNTPFHLAQRQDLFTVHEERLAVVIRLFTKFGWVNLWVVQGRLNV